MGQSLKAIRDITPETYSWKKDSGLYDGGVLYSGFVAQNVRQALPEAVNTGASGKLQVSQVTILAAAINAIKELDAQRTQDAARISDLERRLAALEHPPACTR